MNVYPEVICLCTPDGVTEVIARVEEELSSEQVEHPSVFGFLVDMRTGKSPQYEAAKGTEQLVRWERRKAKDGFLYRRVFAVIQ